MNNFKELFFMEAACRNSATKLINAYRKLNLGYFTQLLYIARMKTT